MNKEDLFIGFGNLDEDLLKRSEQGGRNMNNKRNISKIFKYGSIAACLVVVLVVGSLFWNGGMVNRISPIEDDNVSSLDSSRNENIHNIEESQSAKGEAEDLEEEQGIGEELQSGIDALQASDSLGWIVYEERIYIQSVNMDVIDLENNTENIKLGSYLGRASEFIGYYQKKDGCDGDLYEIADNSELLYLKLDNGGTIWLAAEKIANIIEEIENRDLTKEIDAATD